MPGPLKELVPQLRRARAFRKFALAKLSVFRAGSGDQHVSNGVENVLIPPPMSGPPEWEARVYFSDRVSQPYVSNGVEKKMIHELMEVPKPPQDMIDHTVNNPPLDFGGDSDNDGTASVRRGQGGAVTPQAKPSLLARLGSRGSASSAIWLSLWR